MIENSSSHTTAHHSTFTTLPDEMSDHILSFVSAEGGQLSCLTNKYFNHVINDQEKKQINRSLLKDINFSFLENKSPEDIYQIHQQKVKESVDDTFTIPASLTGLFSTPYLDSNVNNVSAEDFCDDTLSKIYQIHPEARDFMISKGNENAMCTFVFLSQEIITPEDFILNELIAKENHQAIRLKFESLNDDTLPNYNPDHLRTFLDEQTTIRKQNHSAFRDYLEIKLNYLKNGILYDQNPEEAKLLLKSLVDQGSFNAKHIKIDMLLDHDNGLYDFNPHLAQQLNEELISQGNEHAFSKKLCYLIRGLHPYQEQNKVLAIHQLIADRKDQGNTGIYSQVFCYLLSEEISLADFDFTHQDIDREIKSQNNNYAFLAKYYGLRDKKNGYNYNITLDHQRIDDQLDQGFITETLAEAQRQFLDLKTKLSAQHFLDEQVALGHPQAIRMKENQFIANLEENHQMSPDDLRTSHQTIDKQINKGDLISINVKLEGLLMGLNGYSQDHFLLKKFINDLHEQGHRYGSYLKALGLKFGVLGFDVDDDRNPLDINTRKKQARDFIIKHRIAF